jgi:hypothetical protein
VIDAGRVVDVHRDVLGPAELDGEHLDVRDACLDGFGELAVELAFLLVNLGQFGFFRKKWAPRAHFSMWGNVVLDRIAPRFRVRPSRVSR